MTSLYPTVRTVCIGYFLIMHLARGQDANETPRPNAKVPLPQPAVPVNLRVSNVTSGAFAMEWQYPDSAPIPDTFIVAHGLKGSRGSEMHVPHKGAGHKYTIVFTNLLDETEYESKICAKLGSLQSAWVTRVVLTKARPSIKVTSVGLVGPLRRRISIKWSHNGHLKPLTEPIKVMFLINGGDFSGLFDLFSSEGSIAIQNDPNSEEEFKISYNIYEGNQATIITPDNRSERLIRPTSFMDSGDLEHDALTFNESTLTAVLVVVACLLLGGVAYRRRQLGNQTTNHPPTLQQD